MSVETITFLDIPRFGRFGCFGGFVSVVSAVSSVVLVVFVGLLHEVVYSVLHNECPNACWGVCNKRVAILVVSNAFCGNLRRILQLQHF